MWAKKHRDAKTMFIIRLPPQRSLKQGLRYKINRQIGSDMIEIGLFASIIYLLII